MNDKRGGKKSHRQKHPAMASIQGLVVEKKKKNICPKPYELGGSKAKESGQTKAFSAN